MQKHGQRVLNLLSSAASGLKVQFEHANLPTALLDLLDKLVEADDSQPNGLSRRTNATLELAKNEIIDVLKCELGSQEADAERVASLIGGRLGIAVITRKIVQPLLLDSIR